MKFLLILSALLSTSAAWALPSGSTSAGVTLGSPWGLTGRTWLESDTSLDYGLGWDLLNSSKFEVYTDYLLNVPDTFEVSGNKLDFFYGGGLVLRTHSTTNENTAVFGPRVPIGLSYYFTKPDLELFAVVALDVGLIPHTDVFADVALGARFTLF